jgi:hypothetical protein
MVQDGRHVAQSQIIANFRVAIADLMATIG